MDTKNARWANSKDTFGRKMLVKMGWKEGGGLGAGEQGLATNVKLERNLEQKGLGFVEERDETRDGMPQMMKLDDALKSLASLNNKNKEVKVGETSKVEEEGNAANNRASSREDERSKRKRKDSTVTSTLDASPAAERETTTTTTVVGKPPRRERRYKRARDAKDMSKYSKQDLSAILGGLQW